MRLRRSGYLALLALGLVSCTTVAPPPTSVPTTRAVDPSGYHSAADAPRVLDAFDRSFAAGQSSPSDLSIPDLALYSQLLLAAGRWKEAEKALENLDQRKKGDRSTLLALTLLAQARGDVSATEARLVRFEQAFPGDAQAKNLRARAAFAKGDRAKAQSLWLEALAHEENPESLSSLATLFLDNKEPQAALAFADRAVKADPSDDQLWALHARINERLQKYLAAKDDLDRAISAAPDDGWHRLDRGKLAWLHLYDPALALNDLQFASTKLPDNFFAWSALGEVAEDQDRPRVAYEAWMKALSLRPDYRFGYPSAAMLSFRFRDFGHAASFAKEAAKDHPGEYAFPLVEALSYRALGQLEKFRLVLEKARPRYEVGSTVDELFRFLLTPGTDSYLNTAMNLEKRDTIRLRLRFYQGCFYALTKAPGSARAAWDEVAASELKKIPEIGAAREWLDHGP